MMPSSQAKPLATPPSASRKRKLPSQEAAPRQTPQKATSAYHTNAEIMAAKLIEKYINSPEKKARYTANGDANSDLFLNVIVAKLEAFGRFIRHTKKSKNAKGGQKAIKCPNSTTHFK